MTSPTWQTAALKQGSNLLQSNYRGGVTNATVKSTYLESWDEASGHSHCHTRHQRPSLEAIT